MFGMGIGEMLIIAVVALLALGPDKLPEAAKKIGETIRGLRRQTSELRKTIEEDTQLGDAMKEIRSAMRDNPLQEAAKQAMSTTPPRPTEGPPPEDAPVDEPLAVAAEGGIAVDDAVPDAVNDNENTVPARELSDYEKYIHNNGTEAAAEKFGTSVEHAEAAMMASLERATQDG